MFCQGLSHRSAKVTDLSGGEGRLPAWLLSAAVSATVYWGFNCIQLGR